MSLLFHPGLVILTFIASNIRRSKFLKMCDNKTSHISNTYVLHMLEALHIKKSKPCLKNLHPEYQSFPLSLRQGEKSSLTRTDNQLRLTFIY